MQALWAKGFWRGRGKAGMREGRGAGKDRKKEFESRTLEILPLFFFRDLE